MYTCFSVHTVPLIDTHCSLHTYPFSDICWLMYTSCFMQTLCWLSLNAHLSTDRHLLLDAHLSIDRHSLLEAHPSIHRHPLLNAHLSIDWHSLLNALWLLVAHSFLDGHCRHPHLSLCTHPFMDTLLIVPLLWLTHFIQATLAWAVSLHESKLLWLTHFFRAALVWYSILVYQIYPSCSNFVTDALLHLLFLPFSLPVLSREYAHPPLFMLYASCMPSATSSTFHLYRVSWAALHPHCHTSHSCHASLF